MKKRILTEETCEKESVTPVVKNKGMTVRKMIQTDHKKTEGNTDFESRVSEEQLSPISILQTSCTVHDRE